MSSTRLSHDVIRRLCKAEDRPDFVSCPVCGGHLCLFGADEFSCKGNSKHAPCDAADVAKRLHELNGDGDAPSQEKQTKRSKPSEQPDWQGLKLDDYCLIKRLDPRLLQYLFEVRQSEYKGKPVLAWAYYSEEGKILAWKLRLSTNSHDTLFQPADPHVPYGLGNPHLQGMMPKSYDLIIAEGETDCHTLATWGFPVIGISGAEGWVDHYVDLPVIQNAARVFIAEHADQGGKKFSTKILRSLPKALILRPPDGFKDFNELHINYADVDGFFEHHPFLQLIDIGIQQATFERAMRTPKTARPKPAPMREEAFHGVAGKVVRLLEPVMEADREAILCNFFVCAGVLFQHHAYFEVAADKHYPQEYFLAVGPSAIGRKGTTANALMEVMRHVVTGFDGWIIRGLSTGQGLIAKLKKQDTQHSTPVQTPLAAPVQSPLDTEEDSPFSGAENVTAIHPAVLVEISEFAELLAVMKRDENTLSSVMRDGWDGKPLCVLTRKEPLEVRGATLATLGHITRKELSEKLTSTDRANGFANRFIFFWTQRAKMIPRSSMSGLDYTEVARELQAAFRSAMNRGKVDFDKEAKELWDEAYKELTTRSDDMVDALLSRADAHVVRLSLLYALLDGAPVIRKEHLQAALAVWSFAEDSVKYIFGDAADPAHEKILRKLEDHGSLTTSEIRRFVFHDNPTPDWVADKMRELEQVRRVRRCIKEMKSKKTAEAWEVVW